MAFAAIDVLVTDSSRALSTLSMMEYLVSHPNDKTLIEFAQMSSAELGKKAALLAEETSQGHHRTPHDYAAGAGDATAEFPSQSRAGGIS
jgi:hypothetical protein